MATIRDKMGHCLHDSYAIVPSAGQVTAEELQRSILCCASRCS